MYLCARHHDKLAYRECSGLLTLTSPTFVDRPVHQPCFIPAFNIVSERITGHLHCTIVTMEWYKGWWTYQS